MRLRFTRLKVVVVLLVAMGVMSPFESRAQQSEATLQDAQALAKAMQIERFVKVGFEAAIEGKTGGGRVGQAELECFKRTDFSFANDIYAAAFARTLTPGQIKEAVAFFNKPVGQWFLEHSAAIELQSRGVKTAAPSADISPEMYGDLEKFTSGATGKKLLEQREHETPELQNALGAKMVPIVIACKQEAVGKQSGQR